MKKKISLENLRPVLSSVDIYRTADNIKYPEMGLFGTLNISLVDRETGIVVFKDFASVENYKLGGACISYDYELYKQNCEGDAMSYDEFAEYFFKKREAEELESMTPIVEDIDIEDGYTILQLVEDDIYEEYEDCGEYDI